VSEDFVRDGRDGHDEMRRDEYAIEEDAKKEMSHLFYLLTGAIMLFATCNHLQLRTTADICFAVPVCALSSLLANNVTCRRDATVEEQRQHLAALVYNTMELQP